MKSKEIKKKKSGAASGARPAGKSRGSKQRAAGEGVATAPKIRIPKKYQRVYENLVRLRERLTKQISFLAKDNLTRSEDDTEVDFRSKEQGTDNFDRDFALNCVSRDQDAIFEIDEALNRIQIGTYGKCESCGRQIEAVRLASLPYSRMCIACKSKTEAGSPSGRALDAGFLAHNNDKAAAEAGDDEE